jgi:hypothetical protein
MKMSVQSSAFNFYSTLNLFKILWLPEKKVKSTFAESVIHSSYRHRQPKKQDG